MNSFEEPPTNTNSRNGKSRKIRNLQEFDNLNRSSLLLGLPQNENNLKKTKTRKKHALDFLPKVVPEYSKENNASLINQNSFKASGKFRQNSFHSPAYKTDNCNKAQEPSISSTSKDEDIEFKPRTKNINKILQDNALTSSVTLGKTNVSFNSESKSIKKLETKSDYKDTNLNDTYGIFDNLKESYEINQENGKNKLNDDISETSVFIKNKDEVEENNDKKLNVTLPSGRKISIRNTGNKFLNGSIKAFNDLSPSVVHKNITPDTSGNNQGIFDITFPIEEEYKSEEPLISLTLLENCISGSPNKDTTFQLNNKSLQETILTKNKDQNTSKISMKKSMKKMSCNDSVIDLLTPSPKKNSLDKSLRTPTPTSVKNKKQQITINRSATFTKELQDNGIIGQSRLNSALRKKWSKSLRVSVLDNSGNLHCIASPHINTSMKNSTAFNSNFKTDIQLPTKQVKISSPQLVSSTPMIEHKGVKFLKITSSITKSEGKSVKKNKMPNFALIHQKAYDKLENIREMSERKAARAQALLSGQKPQIGILKKSPSKTRKALNYSPKGKGFGTTASSVQMVHPLNYAEKTTKLMEGKMDHNKYKTQIPLLNKNFIGGKMTSKRKSLEKKYIQKPENSSAALMKKAAIQKDQLKAFANKKKIVTDRVENRRKVIQNVRTNRRFELLMQMRNK